jgi:glutaminase
VGFNNELCLAELDSCHKNYSLAYLLQEKGLLKEGTSIKSLIEFYTMACSIELSVIDLARIAGTLANGGINPETSIRCFKNQSTVKNALSHMLSCGMNTYSGEWSFQVGLPAKSGYSGVTMMVVPN